MKRFFLRALVATIMVTAVACNNQSETENTRNDSMNLPADSGSYNNTTNSAINNAQDSLVNADSIRRRDSMNRPR